MILLEYEAKGLLNDFGVPVEMGELYRENPSGTSSQENYLPKKFPVVIKSQVPVGGRGKLGGVKIAKNPDEFNKLVNEIKQTSIKGHLPTNLLIETALQIKQEFYLAITINRDVSQIQFTANCDGGIEIESQNKSSFLNIPITEKTPNFNIIGEQLAEYLNLPSQTFALQDIAKNLYQAFTKNDALLIEINPLILTTNEKLIAGDAKIELDDSAAFRHEWNYETEMPNANFVILNPNGNIATIANGAGLAMATVDEIFSSDLVPANFLDIGGGANEEKVLSAFNELIKFPNTKAIIINIFGGITKCDEIAKAIVSAKKNAPKLPPLFIRLSGNNYDEAKEILDANNILLLPNLTSCIKSAKKEIINDK